MAGRNVRRAESPGTLEQRRELQVAVAVRARNRRPAGRVLLDEVVDHRLAELLFEVDDVVRKAERRGDAPGVVQVVQAAAAAELLLAALVVDLHGQTDDVMTLLGEQGRGDR